VASGQPSPVAAAFEQTVLAESGGQRLTRDQQIKNVFKGLFVEFGVLPRSTIVTLEPGQDD
jgi:hypothetical protein